MSPSDRERLESELHRCWPIAQAHWSRFLLLREPSLDAGQPSVAQINLNTREVMINAPMILEKGLVDTIEALLAHEVGHHVCYPGTMQTHARMRLLERSLIPFEEYSLINLFTDLMINHRLGERLRPMLIRVYRAFTSEPAFHGEARWKRDPGFFFYLAIYEELWGLEAGALMGQPFSEYGEMFPAYRAEARVLGESLFVMGPNVYAQFLYFLSVMVRYLTPPDDEDPVAVHPLKCGRGEPSPADWAEAITPTQAELDAIRRAHRERWFEEDQGERLQENNTPEGRIAGLPGFGTVDASTVPEIMAAYYRREAEKHLLRPPLQRRLGEPQVPTTLEEWEVGDLVREIDWLATMALRGRDLGGAMPIKRVRVAEEEGLEAPLWQPRMEIYLDVSGSMPNPCFVVNAMTLAAQILATGTARAGGWVRALIYSHQPVLFWEWTRSEAEISRFLMHYIGGGTKFPFDILEASVRECAADQPIRAIITDADFDANFERDPAHSGILGRAIEASPHLVLLLRTPTQVDRYRAMGALVVPVAAMEDFPRLAAELALALFPEDRDGRL